MKTLKFNEYNVLREQLQLEGSSINEFVKEITGEFLFEADDTITAKGSGFNWLISPKGSWAKTRLTKAAKKLLNAIKNDILEKFYPQILENQKKRIQAILAMDKAGKEPQEIYNELLDNIKVMRETQKKQLTVVDDGVKNLIANASKRVSSYISSKHLNNNQVLILENYWTVLTVQIHEIVYNSIIEKQDEFIHNIVGENENLVKFVKKVVDGVAVAKVKEVHKEVETAKEKIKTSPAEEEPKAEVPEAKPTAEPEVDTNNDKEADTKKELPKRGEIWKWNVTEKRNGKTERKTKQGKILVVGPGEDSKGNEIEKTLTQVQWYKKDDKGEWKPINAVGTTSTENIMKGNKKEEATPKSAFNPADYSVKSKWNYQPKPKGGKKQKKIVVEVVDSLPTDVKNSVRIKQAGASKGSWVITQIGSEEKGGILDKHVPVKVAK